MRKLKLFFACLLMAVLSIGQVWGATTTYQHIFSAKPSTGNNVNLSSVSWNITATQLGNYNSGNYAGVQLGTKSASGSITLTSSAAWGSVAGDYKDKTVITEVRIWMNAGTGTPTGTVTIGGVAATDDGTTVTKNSSASSYADATCVTYTPASTGNTGVVVINVSTSQKAGYICAMEIDCEEAGGGTPTPSLSVAPTSIDFGTVYKDASVEDKAVAVTFANLTGSVSYSGLTSPFSASGSISASGDEIAISADASTIGEYEQTLTVQSAGDALSKTVTVTMKVVAAPEPTGTFELFSGDITEGDYVIYYGGGAMNTTVTSNRLQYLSVTPAENKLVNPNEAIIWHIAASGDYWTLYNAAVEKYAGGTSTKNQGAMLASVTDYAKWTITGSSTYEFENLGRATGSSDTGNKWLRKNGTYGFACYSSTQSGTGPLTLYKKSDGKPAAPTFTPAAGSYLEAQSVTISAAAGVDEIRYTLDESTPTASSTLYSGAIPVSATTTIKAIAIKDAVSSNVASATYTIVEPLSVTAAIALIPNANDQVDDQFVEGYVCTAGTSVSSGKMTYYISADGSETNRLQIYKGKNLNNTDFSNVGDLAIGDKVVVFGQLKNYGGTPEMNDGNYIVRRTAKGALSTVVVSGTPTKTAYSSGDAFEPAGLVVTATYESGYAVNVASELAASDWSASPATVTEEADINVTATYGGETSDAYPVHVTIVSATLDHISLSYDAVEVYQGKPLPKPVVTAHWSDASTSDVTALASFTGYDKDTPGDQTITVSYQFGTGDPEEATYTVTVNPIYGVELAASVAKDLIETVVGNTESTSDMIVRGIVSQVGSISSKCLTYYISDDGTTTNQLEIYKGKYLSNADFTDGNKLKVGDEVVVTGKVIYYNNTTAEFANGKSQVTSLARTPNFEIADIASFEVGTADLAVSALTITKDGEGAVTLASSDHTEYVSIVDGKLRAVAAGDATITANLAANGIYKAASTTFDVHVIAATIKYAITFDGNGGSGDAPEFASEAAAGANITLPANSYTKTGYIFDGWKVYDENEDEVTVTAGAFTMPASPVTIKAQWAEIPLWAYTYTSNVTLTGAKVKFYGEETEYDAVKAGTGKVAGSVDITIPAQATKLHFHAYGWNDETVGLTVTAPAGVTVSPATEISINSNDGIASNSPFTLAEGSTPMTDAYYVVELSGNTEETTLTFSATSGKRFVLFGVNQEGGQLPVLDHIVVTGDASNKTYDAGDRFDKHEYAGLGANAIYTLADVEQEPVAIPFADIEWSSDPEVVSALTTSVTVTASYGGKQASKEITGLIVNVPDPEIEVSTSSLAFGKVAKGASVTDKTLDITLKSVENATLAISGAGASAFSLDEYALTATGTVTVSASSANVGTFEATLTISDDANQAEAQEVALSITVEAVDDLSGTWNLVTDEADLMPGMQVIIASIAEGNSVTTMGKQAGANEDGNNRVGVTGSSVSGTVLTPVAGTKVFTLVDAGDGKLAFQGMNGKYLYAASSSANHLKEQATNNANGEWSISIEDNIATITAPGSSNRNLMRFNPNNGNPIFACYATNSTTGTLVTIYAKAFDYEREIPQGQLSTTCLPNGGVIVGASIFEVAYMDYNGATPNKIYFDEVEGGIMEAGVPYVVLANEGSTKFGVYYTDNENADAQSNKGLVGYMGEGKYLAENDYFIYNNMFYHVSAEDAPHDQYPGRIHISNNRAYINLSDVPGYNNVQVNLPAPRRRVSLGNGSPKVATGIDALNASDKPVKMIIDGQLFIIRGEKMYDVKGQLVK